MSFRSSYCLRVPAGSPLSTTLRQAGTEASARNYDEAIRLQRQALVLCGAEASMRVEAVILELTLASYQLQSAVEAPTDTARLDAAMVTLLSVRARARGMGMEHEWIQAELGLAAARSMQGRHGEAAEAFLTAACVAKGMGDLAMAGEVLRCSGDSAFAEGDRPKALRRWRAAWELLAGHGVESEVDTDEITIVERLRAQYESRGLAEAVQHFDAVLGRLGAMSGLN